MYGSALTPHPAPGEPCDCRLKHGECSGRCVVYDLHSPRPAAPARSPLGPEFRLIGITGPAGSGKSTAAAYLMNAYKYSEFTLAWPLKIGAAYMLEAITGERPNLDDRAVKETEIRGLGVTPRQLLQHIGTEGVRGVNPDFWLKALEYRIHRAVTSGTRKFVVSDVRFDNEAQWVRDMGGIVVHLTGRADKTAAHSSENGVMVKSEDWIIHNGHSVTIDGLRASLDNLVAHSGSKTYFNPAS